MTKRHHDQSPKIWPDNPGVHFNAYYQKSTNDKRLHERGLENKTRWEMGERKKAQQNKTASDRLGHERSAVTLHASHAPITLPTLKWMKP